MRIGANNDPLQVIRLQAFLKAFEKFDYVTINGVFDEVTQMAVMEFQLRYKDDVLTPWGISEPTGYVYITTLGKINQILCGTGIPGVQPDKVIKDIKSATGKESAGFKEGMGTNTLSSVPVIGSATDSGPKGQNEELDDPWWYPENLTAALFTWPDSGTELLKSLYELLLVLIVLYILGNVLESVLYKEQTTEGNKDVLDTIASDRFKAKWWTIAAGLLVAFGGAYYLERWYLLLPLLIALIATIAWILTRSKHEKLKAEVKKLVIITEKKS
ncbi:MAG: hypothetical protein A3F53_01625 [Candidatus Zambryskibacteria bacterium RIFCSPHIGHO2_12_FULL_48_10]|uniref:Peptidoglycan binding-like domain-containing protein n=1 Tax=Candidatus Zambryskibacteria bacterium RIFCSPHIGHO2_01_FULL_46_25 TaxID=1802738 RepID=A0A1G2T1E2_9BACT|nr:MAG: hypothetical protein A2838_02590 [Candidatus Zambryskibacteria bacterium RIFCSPHIGHO2_01_FULL_46_25]OHB01974.1 MAG: hypothetical protein A3F53_01625 [Candidatus Zambryskibacteria bacterium RIFCSPHIGHO2_12_FULL_48_10]OHB06989.1 MAG: hypothetical protein A3A31_01725 [Candidatus Zambryskibacteria bacterium RIFCSPLOWO2_01_FULL_48_25]